VAAENVLPLQQFGYTAEALAGVLVIAAAVPWVAYPFLIEWRIRRRLRSSPE